MENNIFETCDREVTEKISNLEFGTLVDTGVARISGGFATAEIYDYDDEWFFIELKWGIQSDCENTVHTENYKMDRVTLKIEDA